MIFRETNVDGALIVEPCVQLDARGSFINHFVADWFRDHGLETAFGQASTARNALSGTLRGMHWQVPPHEETKLVRCDRGAVYDVVLDLRRGSPTFRRWHGVELTEENGLAIYVPPGCAHGYQTLRPDTWVTYLISGEYDPACARGVRWNDPAFDIHWPNGAEVTLSERDAGFAAFRD